MQAVFQAVVLITLILPGVLVWAHELPPTQSNSTHASQVKLAIAEDLPSISQTARTRKLPILLVYSAEDCEYCQRLEADVLNPMLLHGDFEQRIIIRKVMIDSHQSIQDFNGDSVNPGQFAYRQGVDVTPTLQFVDAAGKQLVPQMIGYQGADLYSAYLENAIGGSLELIRRN